MGSNINCRPGSSLEYQRRLLVDQYELWDLTSGIRGYICGAVY